MEVFLYQSVQVTDRRNCVIIQPDQGFLFPAVEYVERKVLSLVSADSKPKCVVFDMTHISSMDITSLHVRCFYHLSTN